MVTLKQADFWTGKLPAAGRESDFKQSFLQGQ